MSSLPPRQQHGSATGTPRWVKVFGLVALGLLLLFVILHLVGVSPGGPGSHAMLAEPWLVSP